MSAPIAGSDFDKNQIPPGGLPPPPKYGSMDGSPNYGYQGGPSYQPYGASAPPPTSTYIVSSESRNRLRVRILVLLEPGPNPGPDPQPEIQLRTEAKAKF